MEKAKQAVSGFMAKAGHHDTTVHESVAPAVTRELVTPTRHENIQTAVDKEVHQDHYHTSVQPVHDKEVLPEQHTHNLAAVEHREHHHGNEREVAQRLEQEAAQFRNESVRTEAKHTQSAAPTVTGEHIHHHVHETIQPVVHKETIEPHVVHTTVPIHEVHHNSAQHHSATALPAVSMADFKKQGGSLTGREERYDGFEGEPRSIGKSLGTGSSGIGSTSQHNTSGIGSSGVGSTGHHDHNSGLGSTGTTGHHDHNSGLGSTGTTGHHDHNSGLGSTGTTSNSTGTAAPAKKASLMDKINPKIDANGDGKAGFMK